MTYKLYYTDYEVSKVHYHKKKHHLMRTTWSTLCVALGKFANTATFPGKSSISTAQRLTATRLSKC